MAILIIGGGLSGLTLAYQLQKDGIPYKILESQDRLGGRIMTIRGANNTPMELGATWFATYHHHLVGLLDELNIGYFPQHTEGVSLFHARSLEPPQKFYIPQSESPSYRVKGGTSALISALVASIDSESIVLNTQIERLKVDKYKVNVIDAKGNTFIGNKVVMALPPQLANDISYEPALPTSITNVLSNTHTWMSGSIKFALEYEQPFWRNHDYSGTIYSQTGLAVEVYDQSNYELDKFALVGFLSGVAIRYSSEERQKIVEAQIKMLFGDIATECVSYTDKIWNATTLTSPNEIPLIPHQNNGHKAFIEGYFDDKLHFIGAETSVTYPGYMDSAVGSAQRIFTKLTHSL